MSYLVLKYVGIPQKQTVMPEEECLCSRTGELARESEVEQAKKQKLFLLPSSFYGGFHQKLWPRIRVYLPTSNGPIKNKPSLACPAAWVLGDSRCDQIENQD